MCTHMRRGEREGEEGGRVGGDISARAPMGSPPSLSHFLPLLYSFFIFCSDLCPFSALTFYINQTGSDVSLRIRFGGWLSPRGS